MKKILLALLLAANTLLASPAILTPYYSEPGPDNQILTYYVGLIPGHLYQWQQGDAVFLFTWTEDGFNMLLVITRPEDDPVSLLDVSPETVRKTKSFRHAR